MGLAKLFKMKFINIFLKIIQSPFSQIIPYYFLIISNDKLEMPLIFLWIVIAILNPFSSKLIAIFFITCPLPLFFKYNNRINSLNKMIFKGFSTISMIIIGIFYLYTNSITYGLIVFKEVLPFSIFIYFIISNILALISVVKFLINYFKPVYLDDLQKK